SLCDVKHASEVYRDYSLPFFRSDVEELVADADTGVVDQYLNSIHHAYCISQRGFDLHEVGDVGNDGLGDSRQLVANCRARFGIAIENANARTFLQKACCCRRANSAGASGDEDSFICQSAHSWNC